MPADSSEGNGVAGTCTVGVYEIGVTWAFEPLGTLLCTFIAASAIGVWQYMLSRSKSIGLYAIPSLSPSLSSASGLFAAVCNVKSSGDSSHKSKE